MELTPKGDRAKIQNKPMKRKWNEAGSGAPATNAPSKERRNEILNEWVTNRRLSTPAIAELGTWVAHLEDQVRRRKAGRERETADRKREKADRKSLDRGWRVQSE